MWHHTVTHNEAHAWSGGGAGSEGWRPERTVEASAVRRGGGGKFTAMTLR